MIRRIGNYEVIEEINRTSMTTIYKAEDPASGRAVAIEMLSEQFASDKVIVERFLREARKAENLKHPNIAAIYSVGQEGETPYLVMDYTEGMTLASILRDRDKLPPETATRIASDVCKALEYAHSQGIIHGGVAPDKITIDEHGGAVIAAFSMDRMAEYISPEQTSGREADHRSDIYSLGVVLYEMLTGQALSGAMPPPLRKQDPNIPVLLEALVMECLASDPDNRFQSVSALREALETVGESLSQPQEQAQTERVIASPEVKARRRRRLIPIFAGLGALVLLLAAAGVILGMRYSEQQRQQKIADLIRDAKEYYANAEYKSAIDAADEVLGLDSDNSEAQELKAQTEEAMTKQKEIEKHLAQAHKFLSEGLLSEALTEVVNALELDPYHEEAKNIKSEVDLAIAKTQEIPDTVSRVISRIPVTATTVLEFRNAPVVVNPNVPVVRDMPEVVTYSGEPIVISAPQVAAPAAPDIGRGIVGTHTRVAAGPMRPQGLSMITKNISVADTGLADVAKAVTIGKVAVAPLPKGEPGGRVIGRGKDIQGVFRLVRIKHDLADWWADQSSLVALTEWLNNQTKIKTDMNVEGGSISLTSPMLSKAPLVFFTGHDPSLVRSSNLARGAPIKSRLSEQEKDGMRKYLIEDGGFIYFDDCGVNAPAEAFLRLTLAQLRYAMPEYSVDRIPNDHEIYNNYYDMGGPPVGFDIFWWGTHPPKRNFMEGITVGDHLGALVCRRDYMCAMESVSLPTRSVHYAPGVYRFTTNVVVYALTHGGISDYSHYIPEDTVADKIIIDAPTLVPSLE